MTASNFIVVSGKPRQASRRLFERPRSPGQLPGVLSGCCWEYGPEKASVVGQIPRLQGRAIMGRKGVFFTIILTAAASHYVHFVNRQTTEIEELCPGNARAARHRIMTASTSARN